jgi:hypothetical protein
MGGAGGDGEGAHLAEGVGALAEGAGGVDHVVHDDAVLETYMYHYMYVHLIYIYIYSIQRWKCTSSSSCEHRKHGIMIIILRIILL